MEQVAVEGRRLKRDLAVLFCQRVYEKENEEREGGDDRMREG